LKANIPKELRGSGNKRAQAALKKAREVQKIVEEQVKELDQKEYTATSGGGVVSVVVMGSMRVKSIRIDPEVVNKDDVSMLSDLITAAINEAISFAKKEKDEILNAQTSEVDLSAMLGMF
jgi:DNA-binding YbaB/EbfC family protein